MSQISLYPPSTPPVGGATAANQVLEIAQLTAINANTATTDSHLAAIETNTAAIDVNTADSNSHLANIETSNNNIDLSTSNIDSKTPALGQALAAGSVPVVLTAAQLTTLTPLSSVTVTQATGTNLHVVVDSGSITTGGLTDAQLRATPVPVSGTVAATQSGTWNINNISGTVSLPTGAATAAKQPALGTAGTASADVLTVQGIASMTALKVDGSAVTQPVSIAATVTTTETTSSTSAITSVASSASSVSLLASNASRKNATFYNDSTQICYLKLGATASSTSYTVQMAAGSYYELPTGKIYTGAIDGIWASANGNMRITELS